MSESVSIDCGARLSIERVDALHQEMEQALRDAKDIELKADEVQYCDTAGLQLVLALYRAVESAGHSVSWGGVSETVVETAAILGMKQALGLDEQAAA